MLTKKMTGTKVNRPQLNKLKHKLRPGDTVVVENFDTNNLHGHLIDDYLSCVQSI